MDKNTQKKSAGNPGNPNNPKAQAKGKSFSELAKDAQAISQVLNNTAHTGLDIYSKVTTRTDQQDRQISDRVAKQFEPVNGLLIAAAKEGMPLKELIAERTQVIKDQNTEDMRLRKNDAEVKHLRSKTCLKYVGAFSAGAGGTGVLCWGISMIIKAVKLAKVAA